jgi:hypothetical protein
MKCKKCKDEVVHGKTFVQQSRKRKIPNSLSAAEEEDEMSDKRFDAKALVCHPKRTV